MLPGDIILYLFYAIAHAIAGKERTKSYVLPVINGTVKFVKVAIDMKTPE
jgi:hypothetical protein